MGPGGQNGICLFGTGVVDRGVSRMSEGESEGGVLEAERLGLVLNDNGRRHGDCVLSSVASW